MHCLTKPNMFISLMFAAGCTGNKVATKGMEEVELLPSRVIERIGGLSETPEWASGMIPMTEEKACLKAASDLGRAEFVRQIKDGITAAGQVNEGSATSDVAIESNVAYLSNLKLSGARIALRYWEKVEESDASRNRVLKVRCAAKVAVMKSLLDLQIRKATEVNATNPEIRKKLLEGQKAFLDQIAKEGGVDPNSEKTEEKTGEQ